MYFRYVHETNVQFRCLSVEFYTSDFRHWDSAADG